VGGYYGGQGWEKVGNEKKNWSKVSSQKKIDCGRMLINVKVKRQMKKRQIIHPIILWIERRTGAVMGAGSLWPGLCSCAQRNWFRLHGHSKKPYPVVIYGVLEIDVKLLLFVLICAP
jgi:hypothetical protein